MSFPKNKISNRILVIGGGPAGMIAAGTAAKYGAQVILLEKNNRLGKKLGITGKGRANITHAEPDIHTFISAYGETRKFLYSALTKFSNQDTIQFLESLGVPTKIESDGRVFPKSDKALDVISALRRYLIQNKVQVELNARISQILVKNNRVTGVQTEDRRSFSADAVILCAGGASYSKTGSTGDGYQLAQALGHTVNPPHAALVPLELAESWVKTLQGVTLKNIRIIVLSNSKKIAQYFGDLIFTHFGISGPVVLDCSDQIAKLLQQESVSITIDLLPRYTVEQTDRYLQDHLRKYASRQIQNTYFDLFPKKLVPIVLNIARIQPQKPANQLTKSERLQLAKIIKNIQVTIIKLRPLEEGMVTAGGIVLDEINSTTMESTRVHGLYFAGEVIDITGKSGGYNLQLAISTGYVAGLNAAKPTPT